MFNIKIFSDDNFSDSNSNNQNLVRYFFQDSVKMISVCFVSCTVTEKMKFFFVRFISTRKTNSFLLHSSVIMRSFKV